MATLKTARVVLYAVVVSGAWAHAAAQQAPDQPPQAQQRSAPDEASQAVQPPPPKVPAVRPSEAPATPSLVGLHVFSSDGTRVGEVRSVATAPNGNVAALHIRTGGFLGFGGRIVAVPEGKFIRSGQSIRLDLDSDQVSDLPQVRE